jgi:hypothetical protein
MKTPTTQRPTGAPLIALSTPANWAIAALMAIALAAGGAFDGPSDIEAMQATAASVDDAVAQERAQLKTIAAQAHKQAVRAKKEAQEAERAATLQTQTASAR